MTYIAADVAAKERNGEGICGCGLMCVIDPVIVSVSWTHRINRNYDSRLGLHNVVITQPLHIRPSPVHARGM